MKILVIEDESIIAKRTMRMTRQYFGDSLESLIHCDSLENGLSYLAENEIDLLLLDLNLNGADGFKVLKQMMSRSFFTIIISAYRDKAIEAFEYGVLDFVPKPFNGERLFQALARTSDQKLSPETEVKYLSIQKSGRLIMLETKEIFLVKGARIYSEIWLEGGKKEIHNKSLEKLEKILPTAYQLVHKSYLVDMKRVKQMLISTGGKYQLVLHNGTQVPVSRRKYKELKAKFFG